MKKTIQDVSAEVVRIQDFIGTLRAGEFVTYTEIHMKTQVRMDAIGKTKLRAAAKRAHRYYTCIRGQGIRMSSGDSALPIVGHSVRRADRANRRVVIVTEAMLDQHADMPSWARENLELVKGAFSMLRLNSQAKARELSEIEKAKPDLAPTYELKIGTGT